MFRILSKYRTVLPSTCSAKFYSQNKISSVLDKEFPPELKHIRELNLENSKTLKVKYNELLKKAHDGGGAKNIERHIKRNKKMLVRDRIKLLLDEDSEILETSTMAGFGMEYGDIACAGVVTLIGKVHGIWCLIIANDATVKGGSIYPIGVTKQLRAQAIAQQNHLPTIFLVDSGGGYLPLQHDLFNRGGGVFYNQSIMSGMGIPQAAVVCGSCTAGAAYVPAMADEAIILHKSGTIFLGGPPLVFAATGERVTSEQLGGATLHCKVSGVTDHFANTEEESYSIARDIIATSNIEPSPPNQPSDEPLHKAEKLSELAPCAAEMHQLDPRFVISCIVDGSRFHEFKKYYGETLLTGFGYVKNQLTGFLANNGRLSDQASLKGSHFVQLCSQQNIPIVFLQHFSPINPITSKSSKKEIEKSAETIKSHAKLMQAVACAAVPSICIATGGMMGTVESNAMGSLAMGARFQFTYPNVRTCAYEPSQLAHNIAMDEYDDSDKDDSCTLPSSFYKRKLELYENILKESDAFKAAANVTNDGVILPSDTRDVISICLNVFRQEKQIKLSQNNHNVLQPNFRM